MPFVKKPGFTERKFWAKVEKTERCWIWTGSTSDFGHGQVRIDKRLRRAHCVSWEWANGRAVPDGLCVLHECDNPPCVNPAHLFLGTKKDNTQDMVAKGRHHSPDPLFSTTDAFVLYEEFLQGGGVFGSGNNRAGIATRRQLADARGVSVATVSQLLREVRDGTFRGNSR